MAAQRGYRTVRLPIKAPAEQVPVRMSPRRADALEKIIGEMSLFDGVKLLDIMEAIYVQGAKDGAWQTFQEYEKDYLAMKKAVRRPPGRPAGT